MRNHNNKIRGAHGEERSSRKQNLFEMVKRGNADQVRRILNKMDSSFDIDACRNDTREKFSALHIACRLGHVNIVNTLIEHGAHVRNPNAYHGYTPLHVACRYRRLKVAQRLLEADKDIVDISDRDGYIPLHLAVRAGDLPMMKLLIANGSDINCASRFDGETPLVLAASNGCTSIVEALIDAGANMSRRDIKVASAIHRACHNGSTNVVKLLISRGAKLDEIDREGRTLLHTVVEFSDKFHHEDDVKEILCLLVEKRKTKYFIADKTDHNGRTPLHVAAYNARAWILQWLIENGANVDACDETGLTPLHYASEYGRLEHAQKLLAAGANVNSVCEAGQTAVHKACLKGHLRMLRLLVAHGAIVHGNIDSAMSSPLYGAVMFGHVSIIHELLTVHGVDANEFVEGRRSPLHVACTSGNLDAVKTLLRGGANPNLPVVAMPLSSVICFSSSHDIAETLLLYGANVYQQNEEDHYVNGNTGTTVLRYAEDADDGYMFSEDDTFVESMIRRVTSFVRQPNDPNERIFWFA
eukprot:CAMPEP_0119550664 /NCGR_PEP_ID=MMETSP1352-20130426/4141_1 /TAXON_ID=265584 /ORGANISM="Stauroneis constricta, Strain CCMP1120" /LENGTH=526 /DNA_ID=CAMNT_0007596585 /DNA_START=51 /DNA_END=1631 /DNA_ORIENTATION=-